MADLPTQFWGGYIVGLTVITFIGLVWLVYSVYFTNQADTDVAGHVWDENLREGTNPAPIWWFWLILALMVFSVVYLMLYPGLGRFTGALNWSQGAEIVESQQSFAAEIGPERERLATLAVAEVSADETAMRSANHLFQNHCSACHGQDAAGQAMLFPDLTDAEWQWGGSENQIRQTLERGRTAVMPPWQAALQDAGVAEVTDYVLALADGRGDDAAVAGGKTRYDQLCLACHGNGGVGNALLGAPALNDDVWLYGGSYDAVYESIAVGRTGIMPAFGDRLDATQLQILTAWLTAGAPTL